MNLTIDQALHQAVAAHKAGKLADAERLYRAILAARPQQPDANHNLGVLLAATGAHQDALPFLKTALEANPGQGQFWLSYIGALIDTGKLAEAKSIVEQGRKMGLAGEALTRLEQKLMSGSAQPSAQQINALLAKYNAGNYAHAETLARELTQAFPRHALGWKALGAILHQTGRVGESLHPKQQAALLDPLDAEAHSNLAYTLNDLGRLAEAEASCREAIRLKPEHAEAHSNLGNTLRNLGRLAESEASCRTAVRLKPDLASAHCNLANALKDLGRLSDAEASYRAAIRLNPGFVEAHGNLANTLAELGRLAHAESSYREAIRLGPSFAEAHTNLGNVLRDLGRPAEAQACHREAIRMRPDFATAHSNLLFGLNYDESLSVEAALVEARRYGAMVSAKAQPKFTSWLVEPVSNKLRIGFVSGDFRKHPVGYFIEGLLRHLDGSRFDIHAFTSSAKADELTARIKPFFREWISLVGMSDLEAATAIRERGIHVLIDLSGHTEHNRLPVFSYKPAPVQVSWLGYFATTGLPEMDYFLGDPHMSPQHEAHHFVEQIWNLAETWLCRTPPALALAAGPLPAFSNGYVTFASFGNLSKMNDAVIRCWAGILQRVPGARLFLKAKQLADAEVIAGVQKRFAAAGIAHDSLILEGPSSAVEYFSAYNRADMMLDTFPYPGGTTSVDALWMGVPVLTVKGDRFLSHLGESIAFNAGLPNWIAASRGDYVAKAAAFAADIPRLAACREELRNRVVQSPLFDNARFARNFADALWGMWNTTGRPLLLRDA